MTQLLLATPGLFLMPAESLQGPRWDPDAGQETLVWQVLLGIEFILAWDHSLLFGASGT